jgi:4-amino-4-deoxy-L-arabinose transferase-like glycosyltransferase
MRLFSSILLLTLSLAFIAAEGFDGLVAISLVAAIAAIALFLIKWAELDKDFVIDIFLLALGARMAFGLFIHVYELRDFFGGDAFTFDSYGKQITYVWLGLDSATSFYSTRALSTVNPGWGINYFVAGLYYWFGYNILAAQSVIGAIGAATAPMLYHCSYQMFNNTKVSRIAALLGAIFPAFLVWTSQLLKDGVVVFLLVLVMTMVVVLQKKLNYLAILALVVGLAGIISFRFYIFFMLVVAVAGSLILGRKNSLEGLVRGLSLIVVVGLALTYFGILESATTSLDRFGTFEQLQRSRADLAGTADSGFGEDVDVSTTDGAISTIPIGLMYLFLAPFPWQAVSLRQSVTIPETLIWWSFIPLILIGIGYSLKNKLRASIPIIIFTVMLSLAYSVFQGNVGTAYRQRTQIQVFLFIFIGVGGSLILEKRENHRILAEMKQKKFEENLRNRRRK